MTKERDRHYKIFAGEEYERKSVREEAKSYAQKLRNLGFKARVVRKNFANPNYDVVYSKPKRKVLV